MTFTVITGPGTIPLFAAIAALDRTAWASNPDSQFTPDGEHSWRIWAEHSFVAAVLTAGDEVAGALVGFDTSDLHTHFFHKIFVAGAHRRQGIGGLLLTAYTEHLDSISKASMMTVAPGNAASLALSTAHGFETAELVPGFYGPTEDRLLRRRQPTGECPDFLP